MEHPNNKIERTAKKIHVVCVKASLYSKKIGTFIYF